MHEAAIAQSIVDEVQRLVDAGQVQGRIQVLHLRIGRLTAVIPDYLEFMFGIVAEGTPLEGVALTIEEIPVRARCHACGAEDEIVEACFFCARCGSPQVEIISGREMLIDSVEVEEDDREPRTNEGSRSDPDPGGERPGGG